MTEVIDKNHERAKRLGEWFKSHPEPWEDLKEEINDLLNDAMENLKRMNCSTREFHAGECAGLEDVLDLEVSLRDYDEKP